ncbi:Gfo/Idh/MocA family protein [Paenibacillus eucommiae]|uniref:Dehydrogenase n=1 Tax=Paenibacillus eucommiae TaxID=1355755 RepID=A0ABS4IQB5_9BACL|nr:Gfo/Idh/MocA family oxidoreductase [Paenibacillus eucommiae]MBP1989191.1 putative dehydrogenase [Paenibacillus eucommiae]
MHTFAIIGCQHNHISMFIEEMFKSGHRCIGIYDNDPSVLAAAMAERYNIPLLRDASEIWNSPATIIGTSAINDEKIGIVEACCEYGKHVMLDKPIVTCRDGLNRLEAVIDRGRIQVGLLLSSRKQRSIYTLKGMIDAEELGNIVSITMRKPHKLVPASRPAWHFSKRQNGGIIMDLLIHDFDILGWLTGQEIATASAVLVKSILPQYPDFYDTAVVQLTMTGGTVAQLHADWHTPEKCWSFGDLRIFVTGTRGSAEIRLTGDPSVGQEELLFTVMHDQPFAKIPLQQVPYSLADDFIRRIEGLPHEITHKDLLFACRAAVEADEHAVMIRNQGL